MGVAIEMASYSFSFPSLNVFQKSLLHPWLIHYNLGQLCRARKSVGRCFLSSLSCQWYLVK